MKIPYQVTGVVLIVFSAVMIRESQRLTYYTHLGPGPGFFPFWLSLTLGLLGAVILCQATYLDSDPLPEDFFPTRIGYVRISAIIVSLVGVVVLLQPLGFRLTTLAFLLFLLFALGRQNLAVTILVALAGSFGTYHLFVNLLSVPLPVGAFGL